MADQVPGTISAIEFQELKIKAFLCDNLREQRALEERMIKLKNDERSAISKLDELSKIAKKQVENVPAERIETVFPKEEVITLNEGQIDPITGMLKAPQQDKGQVSAGIRTKRK